MVAATLVSPTVGDCFLNVESIDFKING